MNTHTEPEALAAVRTAEQMLRIRIDEARTGLKRSSRQYRQLSDLLDNARDISYALDKIDKEATR